MRGKSNKQRRRQKLGKKKRLEKKKEIWRRRMKNHKIERRQKPEKIETCNFNFMYLTDFHASESNHLHDSSVL